MVNEYDKFSPVDGVNLKGKLTLGENAADIGGIHLAYMALMRDLADKTMPDTKLDGFTPEQQFFIAYAQIWCENATDASRACGPGPTLIRPDSSEPTAC